MGLEDFPANKIVEQPVSQENNKQEAALTEDEKLESKDNKSEDEKKKESKAERQQKINEWVSSIAYYVNNLDEKMSDSDVSNGDTAKETLISKLQEAVIESSDVKKYIEEGEPTGIDLNYRIKWESFVNPDDKEEKYLTAVDISIAQYDSPGEITGVEDTNEQSLLSDEEIEKLKHSKKVENSDIFLKRGLTPPAL